MAHKRVTKTVDNTKAVKESGKVPLIPPSVVNELLYGGITFKTLTFGQRYGISGEELAHQLTDHRTVEELVALVANRLVSQPHWSSLGVAPPDLDLAVECLTMMLYFAPRGFGRRDLEWLTDTADDRQVRYNVLGFMRFLDLETGELNLDVGTGFTPQYVR